MLAHFISKNNLVSLHCFLNRHKANFYAAFGKPQQNPVRTSWCSFLLLERLQQCEEEALDIWLYHLLFPPSVVLKERSVTSRLETEARLEVTTEPC